MEPFIGQVIAVGFGFAPPGWLPCNGALVSVSDNQTLFALIGTTYGGDGVNSFAVPDLRGRVAVGAGAGSNLSSYALGQAGGIEQVTLTSSQVPTHAHPMSATSAAGSINTPGPSVIPGTSNEAAYAPGTPGVALAQSAVSPSSGGQPHANIQPVLCINYIIAVEGIYPPQN